MERVIATALKGVAHQTVSHAAMVVLDGLIDQLEEMRDTVPPLPSEPAAGPFEDGYDYALETVVKLVQSMRQRVRAL